MQATTGDYSVFPLILALSLLTINDFSQLNQTQVAAIHQPTTEKEILGIVRQAKREGRKVSIAGKLHSQGAHAFYPNGVIIDITKFNKILKLNKKQKLITVQTGATWEQIQNVINPHGLAIKVMQTLQIFTVGGSLSVNCHGRDPNYGPLIESVRSIKILLASGQIVRASRTQNYELFKLAIGGYGLFGIILEAELELTDNVVYRKKARVIRVEEYEQFVQEQVLKNPGLGLHYGIICLAPYDYFEKILVVNYTKVPAKKRIPRKAYKLHDEPFPAFWQWLIDLRRQSNFINKISAYTGWPAIVLEETEKQVTCRNNAMRHPIECFKHEAVHNVDTLQSYFIPTHQFVPFMEFLKSCAQEKSLRIFYALTRYVPKNTESFLSYTTDNYFEMVLFINHGLETEDLAHAQAWTRKVTDRVLACGGRYYLPVRQHHTRAQLERCYPQIHQFLAKKRWYDPNELFMNGFYETVKSCLKGAAKKIQKAESRSRLPQVS